MNRISRMLDLGAFSQVRRLMDSNTTHLGDVFTILRILRILIKF